MSKHAVISGSLSTGFAVTGPFPDWGSPVHAHTVNPGDRQCVVFQLTPPEGG